MIDLPMVVSVASSGISAILGACVGALLSRKATFEAIRWQMKSEAINIQRSYIRNLLEEFKHNKKILHRLDSYIGPGPNVEHFWTPAELIASSLKTDAWDALIKAGVLPVLNEQEQRTLSITNRTVYDVKTYIKEISVNWLRIREWEKHDIESNNPQPASTKIYSQKIEPEAKETVKYSIKRLEEALISR